MKSNTKKVLKEQGTQVVQALKWIGGALFGDADEVLDDMAARGDDPPDTERSPAPPVRQSRPPVVQVRARVTAPRPVPKREVIDVEGFEVDEDDE
jgi:hypothetical protein